MIISALLANFWDSLHSSTNRRRSVMGVGFRGEAPCYVTTDQSCMARAKRHDIKRRLKQDKITLRKITSSCYQPEKVVWTVGGGTPVRSVTRPPRNPSPESQERKSTVEWRTTGWLNADKSSSPRDGRPTSSCPCHLQ